MKSKNNNNAKSTNTANAVVSALLVKKDMKVRFQNGESLQKIAKEKGLTLALPL